MGGGQRAGQGPGPQRIDSGIARRVAACGSLADALHLLAATPHGANVRRDQTLAAAQHEVAGTLLWDLQVLAGWLPRDGVRLLRTLGGWFEIANVDELQTALAASAWRDPGRPTAQAIRLGMCSRWVARIAEMGEPARTWAAGAAALLVPGELAGSVPVRARWVLAGITSPTDLWRAETALMARAEQDGLRLLRTRLDRGVVLGAAAVMACHARGPAAGRLRAGRLRCRPTGSSWDGPALAAAREAHGRALEAAVRHAAAAGALRAVEAEALATRYRLRAVKNRWIPRLEQALADVTLALEEQELADSARLRLATRSERPARQGPTALTTGGSGR